MHIGEGFAKVGRKPVYNARAPPFAILTLKDGPPDVPIEQHHGRVRGHDRPQALLLDALLEVAQDPGIARRQTGARRRDRKNSVLSPTPEGVAILDFPFGASFTRHSFPRYALAFSSSPQIPSSFLLIFASKISISLRLAPPASSKHLSRPILKLLRKQSQTPQIRPQKCLRTGLRRS